jgi:hypothetical protein
MIVIEGGFLIEVILVLFVPFVPLEPFVPFVPLEPFVPFVLFEEPTKMLQSVVIPV